MHISELIAEQQLDELSLAGIGQGIGKIAGGVGRAAGNVQGAWQGAQDAYGQARDRTAKVAQRNVSRAGGVKAPVQRQPITTQQPPVQTPNTDQGQAVDLDQVKQQSAAQQAQGQVNQQQAMQQMQTTAQANQTIAVKDAEIKQASDDAKAKPPFQQTAGDKLAIKLARSKGIRESDVGIHSKFLVRML